MNDDFFREIAFVVQEACDAKPETQGRLDEERQYLVKPAPNAIRWCVDAHLCNSPSLYEYTRSYQVIRDVFQLRCPICNPRSTSDCWDKTRAELDAEHLLEWDAKLNEDVCPSCSTPRSDFEEDGLLERVNALHLVCGQRSGKSVTAALIGTYIEHRILTIAHGTPGGLHAYLGLTLKDPMEATFLASNEVQGQDTIWAKYRAFREGSPWFQRYAAWVKEEEKSQNTPPGMERWTYAESNRKVVNEHPDCKLIINSLNSNSAGLRGRTRIFGGLDEISHMHGGDSRMSADEIFRAVDNSLQTIRSRAQRVGGLGWLGFMCSVTSPLSKDDKGMRLLREADNVPGMLAYHYTTWEFNPYEPRENFEAMYAKDPVGAERDFGARPPMAAHPLIWDVTRFRSLVIDEERTPAATFATPRFVENGHTYIGLKARHFDPSFAHSHFVAFDAGKNFDAFAGACGHGEVHVDEETGAQRTKTVIDWVFRILPEKGTEVYYDHVYGVVREMMQFMPIQRVEFDRWNSVQLIQQFRKLGIAAEQKSLKNKDWVAYRQDAYAGRISMLPPPERDFDGREYVVDPPVMAPETCALYELEGLEEDPDTQKVYNPRKGLERGFNSNDVAQVVVHVHTMVQTVGYNERNDDRSRAAAKRRSEGEGDAFIRGRQGNVFNAGRMGGGASRMTGGRGW